MRPLYLNGCLAWFHDAAPQADRLPVVLCQALGREARWIHRTLRRLADRLAAAGMPTLRFDYRGTGDSDELKDGEHPVRCWRDDVHEAANWLRRETGHARIGMAGIRFGALLAADVAGSRDDVEALVLLAPLLSGRSYARELRVAAIGGPYDDPIPNGIELDGMMLSNATLAAIGKIDLTDPSAPPARQVLVMNADDKDGRVKAFVDKLVTLGARAEIKDFPRAAAMLRDATSNAVPEAALGMAASWMRGADRQTPAAVRADRPRRDTAIRLARACREVPVQFGLDGHLTGVLCEPAPLDTRNQAMLIVNTGGDRRAGIGQFGVRMARALAERGVASLRMDFAGLGDSCLPGDVTGHLYETSRAADIRAGLDLLEEHGYAQLGAAGMCTGAYHLLHASGEENRLRWLTLINMVTFQWRAGDILEVAQRRLGWSTGRYIELARQRETWRRLTRGDVNARHVVHTMRRRVLASAGRTAAEVLRPFGIMTAYQPHRLVLPLLRRGTRVQMVLAAEDPGVAALETAFGRKGRGFTRLPGATLNVEPRLDHTLSRVAMQDRVIALIADHLDMGRGHVGMSERLPSDAQGLAEPQYVGCTGRRR